MNQNSIMLLMKPVWPLLVVNTCFSCLFGCAFAAEERGLPIMSNKVIVASVRGNDMQVFEKVANDFYVERQLLSRELLSILQDKKSSNFQKCSAVYFLGEMRMPDVVATLAVHITLHQEASDDLVRRLPVLTDYPVVEALVKIGKPSTQYMVRNLEDNSDSLSQELSVRVIRNVEGVDLGGIIIQKASAKQTNSEKKKRLQTVLSSKCFADAQN